MSDPLVIDFTQVEDLAFEPIPPGVYAVQLEEAERITSRSGKPMLRLVFGVLEDQDGDVSYAGRKLFHNFVLIGKSLPFFKSFLETLGYDFDDPLQQGALNIDELIAEFNNPDEVVEIYARVGTRQYEAEGEMRTGNTITRFMSAGGEPEEDEDEI